MQRLVVLFNEDQSLVNAVSGLALNEGDSLTLVYCGPHRPARLKRWVSKSGWDRLTLERARKLSQAAQDLVATRGCHAEVDAVLGEESTQIAPRAAAAGLRCIDARAPRYSLNDAINSVRDTQGRTVPVTFKRRTHAQV